MRGIDVNVNIVMYVVSYVVNVSLRRVIWTDYICVECTTYPFTVFH